MSRAFPFFLKRLAHCSLAALVTIACGDPFETVDVAIDGSGDAANPPRDASGEGGRAGSSGAGGTGTGGAAGIPDASSDLGTGDGPGQTDVVAEGNRGDIGYDHIDQGGIDAAGRDADSSPPSDAPDASYDVSIGDVPTSPDGRETSSDAAFDADASVPSDARDVGPSDIVCTEPVVYYKDEDGDGFGKNTDTASSCTPLSGKWSTIGGDCRDDLPAVKPFRSGAPNPPAYSGTGYPATNQPAGVSFDYDCNGTEDADPTNAYGADPDCSGLLNCNGTGYIAADPSRQGPGINPRCGSTTLKKCKTDGLNCSSDLIYDTVPYRCR
jgi:hypothetical protein